MVNKYRVVPLLMFLVLIIIFSMAIGYNLGYSKGEKDGLSYNPNLLEYEENLFKTVAHIDMSDRTDLKLIYSDMENDISYYMYTGERSWISEGYPVYFYDGTCGTVCAKDIYGFYVSDAPEVTFGYSGTAVLNQDGQEIGYVSERLSNGSIYCIWN